jgi:Putative adhesin
MGAMTAPTFKETRMPTFDTPDPITATIDVVSGDVRIRAGDRDITTVTVEPSDPSNDEDRKAADRTRVEYTSPRLLVKAPKLRSWRPHSAGGSIDLTIELPAGSNVVGGASLADFQVDGRIGECRIRTGLGHIRADRTSTAVLKTGIGDVSLDRATGHVDITASSGEVRLRELDEGGVIKNSNGDTWVGATAGELRISAANGDIAVDHAQAGVDAKSANGDVRLGEVVRGSIVLETKLGDLVVGVREGTAAWLDVRSHAGRVHNALDAVEAPEPATETVEVRARTAAGDVAIRRP